MFFDLYAHKTVNKTLVSSYRTDEQNVWVR